MEWMKLIGDSVRYIEEHLTEELSVEEIARHIGVSSFYYQKGFAMLCGFTVAEYIRGRRLACAGNDLMLTDEKIIDIALKYGYDSPDSFAKAFTRFHGSTPSAVRKEKGLLKTFAYEGAKQAVPQFWKEHFASGKGKDVCGAFGINIDEKMGKDTFEYLIADPYKGGDVPDGFVLRTIPSFWWAVFPCKGALPSALQDVNTKIFTEWLPAIHEYEFAAGYCVEMYDDPQKYAKGTLDENYYCEIWIPVKRKQTAS